MLRSAALFFLCTALVAMSSVRLESHSMALPAQFAEEHEALILPRGELLSFVTFGYQLVAADILWFNTVNYFGKHYSTDKRYRWLYHMCDLVTSLNPKARHVYTFGATMRAWEGNAANDAVALLSKASQNIPGDWELHYLRGFTELYFLKDREQAHQDFVSAAKLPGAHVIVQRLAARELNETVGPEEARQFLVDILRVTKDPMARAALEAKLREIAGTPAPRLR